MIVRNRDRDLDAMEFCEAFLACPSEERYVLGRNVYSTALVAQMEIAGVIDDFTPERVFEGVPVVRTGDVPTNALVLNAAGGRSLTARAQLDCCGLRNLDYFAFLQFSGLVLPDIIFNEGFAEEYGENRGEYDWIYSRFADQSSRELFDQLVGFRNTPDISYLHGFKARESEQYFEDFLKLRATGEVFVDVGCFDGSNSLEFARLAPDFRAIHAFEPDPHNFEVCVNNLRPLHRTSLHHMGLSDKRQTLKLSPGGSGSKISAKETIDVVVDRLDDVLSDRPTLIKMDIEGAEHDALRGTHQTVAAAHPRLAKSVYRQPGDFHRIPRLILAIRDDYDIYIRHYTETIYETVMFFLPRRGGSAA